MPRGSKAKYTDKQKRMAEHIEEGYERRGVPEDEAERRAWATVNKETGGGKQSGSGRGKPMNLAPARKGWPARRQGCGAPPRCRALAPRPRRRPLRASAAALSPVICQLAEIRSAGRCPVERGQFSCPCSSSSSTLTSRSHARSSQPCTRHRSVAAPRPTSTPLSPVPQ